MMRMEEPTSPASSFIDAVHGEVNGGWRPGGSAGSSLAPPRRTSQVRGAGDDAVSAIEPAQQKVGFMELKDLHESGSKAMVRKASTLSRSDTMKSLQDSARKEAAGKNNFRGCTRPSDAGRLPDVRS